MGARLTAVPAPMPASFRVEIAPGTRLERAQLTGGHPRRRVQLTPTSLAIVQAFTHGSTIGESSLVAGCDESYAGAIARRLVQLGMAAPRPPSTRRIERVTAVIPAHNAAATIGGAIRALDGLADVIVIDDGSSDDTGAVAEAAGARVVRHDCPLGPAAARNAGMALLDGGTVVLLDSDTEPELGWLGPLLDHLQDPVVGGVAPRIVAVPDGSLLARHEGEAGVLDRGAVGSLVRPDGAVTFVSTTALVLRHEVWEELGGFAEDLRFGEDLDFVWRAAAIGRPVVYEPASLVRHHHRATLRAHLCNRARYGTASGRLSRRHPGHPRAGTAPTPLAAAGGAALLGLPLLASSLALGSVGLIAARLVRLGKAPGESLREAGWSTVRSTRSLAGAVSAPWLPVALLLAIGHRGSRVAVLGAISARHALAWHARRRAGTANTPTSVWLLLRFAEDLALSVGITRGCVTARTLGPMWPAPLPGPTVTTTVLGRELVLP